MVQQFSSQTVRILFHISRVSALLLLTLIMAIPLGNAQSSNESDSIATSTSHRGRVERKTKLQKKCSQKKPFPRGFIYKTLGSTHFSKNDVRRNTIGLIIKPGVRMFWPGCLDVLDKKGNNIAKLDLYATGSGWAARYYAGVGCASGTPFGGEKVAQLARKRSRSTNIYIDFGKTCYGPITANRCIGSQQC
jgi:hypothetical protein